MGSFFNNLFHKKSAKIAISSKSTATSEESILLDHNDPNANVKTKPSIPSSISHLDVPQFDVGIGQSVGMQRDHNEDSLFTLTTNLSYDDQTINFGLYIIADGMGGHENGELASRLAVGKLATYIINSLCLPLISSDNKLEYSIQEVVQTGVMQAHQTIKKETAGGGTTLTASLIMGDQMTIAHIGDSRAYIINPNGEMNLLTHDHSLVKRLEEIGQITPEEASTHPQRNYLYRALGQGESTEADISSFQIQKGSQFLLCSDGLWGVVPDPKIAEIIHSSSNPQFACQSLVQLANKASGPDNISVILIRSPD